MTTRHDPSPLEYDRKWLFWEAPQDRVRLTSGLWAEVRPGDSLLVDVDPRNNTVVKIHKRRKRVLH